MAPPTPDAITDFAESPTAPLLTLRGRRELERRLRKHDFSRPRPAVKGQPSESDELDVVEEQVAHATRERLSATALAAAESELCNHAIRRTVRSYWTYKDRVGDGAESLEAAAELRVRFDLDALARDDEAARRDADRLLRAWDNIGFAGFDEVGHPVCTERVVETLLLANRVREDPEDLLKGRAVCTEVFQALKRAASTRREDPADVIKHVFVVDMTGVRLAMVTKRVTHRFQHIMKTLELVYPEVAWRTYVVNAPSYLIVIWYVVKSWLDKVTVDKVVIMSTNKEKTRDRMLADGVPLHSIPRCCGGQAAGVSLADLYRRRAELEETRSVWADFCGVGMLASPSF